MNVRPLTVLRAFCSLAANAVRSRAASMALVRCRSWLCTKPCALRQPHVYTPYSLTLWANHSLDENSMHLSRQI